MIERRQFTRVKYIKEAQVTFSDQSFPAEVLDISLNGMLLDFNQAVPLELGKGCECNFRLRLEPSDIVLNFVMVTVHSEGSVFGFRFERLDVDSVAHLRRLLELNLGSDAAIERELPFLLRP